MRVIQSDSGPILADDTLFESLSTVLSEWALNEIREAREGADGQGE